LTIPIAGLIAALSFLLIEAIYKLAR